MQSMTWPLGRLGSRLGLLFEPGERRVMHSGLGRFLDQPLDFAVGLIEPDGTERVLPFTAHGRPFYATEQFERINSITFRGFSETAGLRFELNFHAPFYPQDEELCVCPAFYFELRVAPAPRVRLRQFNDGPATVRMFVRLSRPDTQVSAQPGHIDLSYDVPLHPTYPPACGDDGLPGRPPGRLDRTVRVHERIHSLNEGASPITDERGRTGLMLELPVTREGSGIKWRLVWASHVRDPVLNVHGTPAPLRYNRWWSDLDAVLRWAIEHRDANLARSRRFEKLLEQAPLTRAQWHLLVLAFQSYLTNTWWCQTAEDDFFSVWEGNMMYHNTLDVGYNMSLLYLTLWPSLLRKCLDQWSRQTSEHPSSGGLIMNHDMGGGVIVDGPYYGHPMPVEENSNFLLMLQAYAHWTGDVPAFSERTELLRRVGEYLLWCDTEKSGFPSEGTANTLDDGSPAVQFSRSQTYLAIKRACALGAASDLLSRCGDMTSSDRFSRAAAQAIMKIEAEAWLDDHYAVCVDRYGGDAGVGDSGEVILVDRLEGWDDYSIYTTNALLLPSLIAQPLPFDLRRLHSDLINSYRETLRSYGCGHTSSDQTNIWISQNLWRDFTGRYLNIELVELDTRYWDLQVCSNTGANSFGYIDTHIGNELAFNPRGGTAFGIFLAGPRLVVDRLDAEYYAVNPDRHRPQRWPLLPLADWEAGKIPICVVHEDGRVTIEGEIEPVKVIEPAREEPGIIG
jgi:xylan 1,4-beta-xylosidase